MDGVFLVSIVTIGIVPEIIQHVTEQRIVLVDEKVPVFVFFDALVPSP